MGLPDIVIEFTKKAVTAVKVGTGGIVGIILKDSAHNGALILNGVDEIPTGFTADNQAYIERAFIGLPKKVIVYTLPTTATDYNDAFKYFGTVKVNYMCGAPDMSQAEATAFATWLTGIRANSKKRPCAVLPNTASDNKGIINFKLTGTGSIEVGEADYTVAEYCSRIAGLLAGIDLKVSATYKPLAEVTGIPVATDDEVDAVIDAGGLTLYNDGERIVIARGVNSLVTVTETETEDLKKIKILAIQDMIETDIFGTINASYIGNYSNSYDNKILLITAIKGYLSKLEDKGYLATGKSTMEINVAKQKAYLEGIGVDTSELDEQAIKEYNTGSNVFLKGKVSILDAIEDVDIVISKE